MDTKICSIDGCGRPLTAKGLCALHYQRKKNGIPFDLPIRSASRVCSIPDCGRQHAAKGLCSGHYMRLLEGRSLEGQIKEVVKGRGCSTPGCSEKHSAKGYCAVHYSRWVAGKPLSTPKRERVVAKKVDDIRWKKNSQGYMIGHFQKRVVWQHRVVWEQHHGRVLHPFENIHHINGIRHDNRIENLELWTKAQPSGQRPEDLVKWVVENYPELVANQMKKGKGSGKSHSKTPARVNRVAKATTSGRRR
jgi:hypothetical protein